MFPRPPVCFAVQLLLALLSFSAGAQSPDAGESARQHILKAKELEKEKKLDEARQEAARAVLLAPKNDSYHAYYGYLENRYGNPAEGLRLGLDAVRLNSSVGWYSVVVMEGAYGSMDDALAREYANKLLKAKPKDVDPNAVEFAGHIVDILGVHRYRLEWTVDPKKEKWTAPRTRLILPLPAKTPYQEYNYQVKGALEQKPFSQSGEDAVDVIVDNTTPVTLTATVQVFAYNYKSFLAKNKSYAPLTEEARQYLGKTDRIDPANPRVKRIAATLKANTPLATVKNALRWLEANISYKLKNGSEFNEFKTLDEILDRRHTKCDGYSALFVALCRAAGVPAREVEGFAKGGPEFARPGCLAGHMWAEFYLAGGGWVVVEPQRIRDLGHIQIDRIEMRRQDAPSGGVNHKGLWCIEPKYTELK
jgi:tetratricopeptide (TPR) repeat protein